MTLGSLLARTPLLQRTACALLPIVLFAGTTHAAEPIAFDQTMYEQLINTSGASNGAAEVCGAAAPDVAAQHDNMRINLLRFGREYGFSGERFDALYEAGRVHGCEALEDMRRRDVNGCMGVLQSLQIDRTMQYNDMKRGIAEVTGGLPDPAQ